MRPILPFVMAGLVFAASPAAAQDDERHQTVLRDVLRTVKAGAYQGRDRGPEQTERFSRKVKVGRDGRISIGNISGDIVVTAGSGDEVSIEAVKRTRGDRSELANTEIIVEERAGRVEVRAEPGRNGYERNRRGDGVSVDFTVIVPATAALDLHSVSGSLKVTGVRGSVRAETVSGNVTTADTPKLEQAKSVSGDVSMTGAAADGDLTAGSISGNVTAKGLKARGLELGSVSGDVILTDVECERLGVKSVSGDIEYSGSLARSGRYEINTHSGSVRLTLGSTVGFELTANSFSGTIRSDLPLTLTGNASGDRDDSRGRRGSRSQSIRATFGDGSAILAVHSFSGDIVIAKR